VLIAIDLATGSIVRVSANAGEIFGVDAGAMLGTAASHWLGVDAESGSAVRAGAREVEIRCRGRRRTEAWTYLVDGVLCVELPLPGPFAVRESGTVGTLDFLAMLEAVTRADGHVRDVAQLVCESIHRITGFDRVYLCRFDSAGHGYVPAEHLHAHFPSLREHHFPRSDVPERIRRLYLAQRFRLISDAGAPSVAVLVAPGQSPSLDMTRSSCRAVAGSHLDYLRNMGVVASTSFGVVQDGRLTALFGGHHHAPRRLSCLQLIRCQQLAETFGSRATELELRAHQAMVDSRRAELLAITESFAARHCAFYDFVAADPGRIARLLSADAIVVGQGEHVFSDVLSQTDARRILAWCIRRLEGGEQASTEALGHETPSLADLSHFASGVLAIALDRDPQGTVLAWLRREVPVERKWGGDPAQPLQREGGGPVSPRMSFQTYVQQLKGTAPPWERHCTDLAMAMKSACNQILAGHYARRAQEEAERATQLMNEFLANVSHELRTPMHSIIGFSEAMIDRADAIAPDRRRQYLEIIRGSGHRLLELINDLLHLSKLESGMAPAIVEADDIAACIDDAIAELRPLAERKGVRIRGPRDSDVPPFAFDRRMIARLLVNLISNAVQYTPEAGRVTIALACRRDGRAGGACCEITVTDTGIGIPPDELERVFDKFIQSSKTKSGAGGTGLGLAICRRIAEEHGGRIWAESPSWGGARLVVQLPMAAAPAASRADSPRAAAVGGGHV
jgi:two-component system, chemotaxis family, sensor kinase Cph1